MTTDLQPRDTSVGEATIAKLRLVAQALRLELKYHGFGK